MKDSLLALLRTVDTPTVCNAIETAQGKRGFAAFTRGTMLSSAPTDPPVVGFARTARIAGLQPPTEPADVIKARRMDYYRSMASGPRPALAVIEDTDYPDCISAWWGEVNTTIHSGLGLCGALTNGVMRDLGDLAPDFPVIAGSVGPSHGFVHVREVGTPVNIFGLTVEQDDLIHADRHGALVVPAEVIPDLESAIDKLIATEQIILGPAREPDFDMAKLEAAWTAFEASRT
ncbi:MAG: RraA family protein [Alphaproteobacteria bacterium]|nr:RraA family protein [Alphaproteobacteria bacterium]